MRNYLFCYNLLKKESIKSDTIYSFILLLGRKSFLKLIQIWEVREKLIVAKTVKMEETKPNKYLNF